MKPESGRRWLGKAVRVAFGLAGAVFVVLAFRDSWNRSRAVVFPPAWRLAPAACLMLASPLFAAAGWSRLFERARDRTLMRAFLLAQPAKYIPGGAWQIVGQVGLSHRTGVPLDRAVAAFPVWIIVQLAAAGLVGSALAVFGTASGATIRWLSLAGLLPLALLHRSFPVRLTMAYARRRKTEATAALVPSQAAILGAWVWTSLAVLAAGGAFALVIDGLGGPGAGTSVPTFALAWIVGFLAVPVPGGVGVREGAMLALAGPGAGATIAASVFQRLLAIAAEVVLALAFLPGAARIAERAENASDPEQTA
jgi:hypothetical protein